MVYGSRQRLVEIEGPIDRWPSKACDEAVIAKGRAFTLFCHFSWVALRGGKEKKGGKKQHENWSGYPELWEATHGARWVTVIGSPLNPCAVLHASPDRLPRDGFPGTRFCRRNR